MWNMYVLFCIRMLWLLILYMHMVWRVCVSCHTESYMILTWMSYLRHTVPYMPDQKSVEMHSVYLYATSRCSISFLEKKNPHHFRVFFVLFRFILFPFLHVFFFNRRLLISLPNLCVCMWFPNFIFFFNCCLFSQDIIRFGSEISVWCVHFLPQILNLFEMSVLYDFISLPLTTCVSSSLIFWTYSFLCSSKFMYKQPLPISHRPTTQPWAYFPFVYLLFSFFFQFKTWKRFYRSELFFWFQIVHLHSMSISFSLRTYSIMCVASCMREKNHSPNNDFFYDLGFCIFCITKRIEERIERVIRYFCCTECLLFTHKCLKFAFVLRCCFFLLKIFHIDLNYIDVWKTATPLHVNNFMLNIPADTNVCQQSCTYIVVCCYLCCKLSLSL